LDKSNPFVSQAKPQNPSISGLVVEDANLFRLIQHLTSEHTQLAVT